MSNSNLEAVFFHFVLPPQLPPAREADLIPIEFNLTRRLIAACNRFSLGFDFDDALLNVKQALEDSLALNDGGNLNKTVLLRHLKSLDVGQLLICHVVEQNAGLLIRRVVE